MYSYIWMRNSWVTCLLAFYFYFYFFGLNERFPGKVVNEILFYAKTKVTSDATLSHQANVFVDCEEDWDFFSPPNTIFDKQNHSLPTARPAAQSVTTFNRQALVGSEVTLSCPVTGSPAPTIEWSRKNGGLPADAVRYRWCTSRQSRKKKVVIFEVETCSRTFLDGFCFFFRCSWYATKFCPGWDRSWSSTACHWPTWASTPALQATC